MNSSQAALMQARPYRRLLQRWLFKGAFGRDTRRTASKALDAADRLDLRPYLERVIPPAL